MSDMFLAPVAQDDLEYDGFYDGQNKTIPDNTELTFAVTDGFVGIEDGKTMQVCIINIMITTPGEFYGQKYKYNAKLYDIDANKRDLAMRNLGVLDVQAGQPMATGKLPLTTENIQDYWAGSAEARVKFGLFIPDDEDGSDEVRHINFVRGFAYDRSKMRKPVAQQQQAPQQQASPQYSAQPASAPQPTQQQAQPQTESDIDF